MAQIEFIIDILITWIGHKHSSSSSTWTLTAWHDLWFIPHGERCTSTHLSFDRWQWLSQAFVWPSLRMNKKTWSAVSSSPFASTASVTNVTTTTLPNRGIYGSLCILSSPPGEYKYVPLYNCVVRVESLPYLCIYQQNYDGLTVQPAIDLAAFNTFFSISLAERIFSKRTLSSGQMLGLLNEYIYLPVAKTSFSENHHWARRTGNRLAKTRTPMTIWGYHLRIVAWKSVADEWTHPDYSIPLWLSTGLSIYYLRTTMRRRKS